jgi:hypothetical protein
MSRPTKSHDNLRNPLTEDPTPTSLNLARMLKALEQTHCLNLVCFDLPELFPPEKCWVAIGPSYKCLAQTQGGEVSLWARTENGKMKLVNMSMKTLKACLLDIAKFGVGFPVVHPASGVVWKFESANFDPRCLAVGTGESKEASNEE